MLKIPLQPIPAQSLNVQLAGQLCTISLRQVVTGLYFDLLLGAEPIVQGVICEDRNRLVRRAYTGFVGDFAFGDLQGKTNPYYTGLNDRYVIMYLDPDELPAELG